MPTPTCLGHLEAFGETPDAMQYYEPNFLDEALVLLERFGSAARILAGGTRLRFQLRSDEGGPNVLVNVRRIADLSQIAVVGGHLRIGALATAAKLRRHAAVLEHAPLLAAAAATMGAAQLQTVATLGGNVSSGDPASDLAVALLAYDAVCEIAAGDEGAANVPIDAVLTRQPAFSARELLVAVRIPLGAHRFSYQKMTTRRGFEMAIVAVALRCRMDGDVIGHARIALAGAAPCVIRAPAAEQVLTGARPSGGVAREAGSRAASVDARPHDDARASAEYRRALVATLTERAVADLL